MNKDILYSIKNVLSYIELRLTQKIQLDELVEIAHISKFHLHRLLSQVVEQPLMNYIRARKLSASIELLLEPRYNILDICNLFAFEHEQSYIRAFKKQFGLTPSQFRRERPELVLTEKTDLSYLIETYDGIIFQPRFKFMPDIPLVGIRHAVHKEVNNHDYKGIWVCNDFIANHRRLVNHTVQKHVLFVLSHYSWVDDNITYYIPSVQVSQSTNIPKEMELNVIPAGACSGFTKRITLRTYVP